MKILNNFKNAFIKLFNKKKYLDNKELLKIKEDVDVFQKKYENYINKIQQSLKNKKEISFLHSGHIGDIINVLPVIKELSKTHNCSLYIQLNLPVPVFLQQTSCGQFFMNKKIYDMLNPLLVKQSYIKKINIYNDEHIDINFDIIRDLLLNLLFDNVRYGFHVAVVQVNLNEKFLEVENHFSLKNKIVILRSLRYQNPFIDYSFLEKYENAYYIGTYEEYKELKKIVKNLQYHDCKNFLDMAMIIKNSKLLIGNSSLGIDIADALKSPRLLEASPYFPARQVHGDNGYDFYFQAHFEKYFHILYNKKD